MAQENVNPEKIENEKVHWVIAAVIKFLELLMSTTIARRIVCLILIAADVHRTQIAGLTGVSDRTIRTLQKAVKEKQPISSLLAVKAGRGRKSKLEDIESEIVRRIETGDYQTRAEVVQMIKDEFGIEVSVWTAARLLKKTAFAS